jgi:hypothetical protein
MIFIEVVGTIVTVGIFCLGIYHGVEWFKRRRAQQRNQEEGSAADGRT